MEKSVVIKSYLTKYYLYRVQHKQKAKNKTSLRAKIGLKNSSQIIITLEQSLQGEFIWDTISGYILYLVFLKTYQIKRHF